MDISIVWGCNSSGSRVSGLKKLSFPIVQGWSEEANKAEKQSACVAPYGNTLWNWMAYQLGLIQTFLLLLSINCWHFISGECRLDSEYPVRNMFKLFVCAICQVELESGQGISIHEGLSKPGKVCPWDGPFLCHSCQEKKEAMEGKRPSRGIISSTLLTYLSAWKPHLE